MKRSSRTPAKLPESTRRKLNMYALAASAAGVSLLALANASEAKIVYTPAHRKLPLNKDFFLDVNHDRIDDFKFRLKSSYFRSSDWIHSLRVDGLAPDTPQRNGVLSVSSQSQACAAALPKQLAEKVMGEPDFERGCTGKADKK